MATTLPNYSVKIRLFRQLKLSEAQRSLLFTLPYGEWSTVSPQPELRQLAQAGAIQMLTNQVVRRVI